MFPSSSTSSSDASSSSLSAPDPTAIGTDDRSEEPEIVRMRRASGESAESTGPPSKKSRKSRRESTAKSESVRPDKNHMILRDKVPTLLDLAAKITAENVTFQTVEERYSPIPEPVQKRILFWSFPRDEMHIRMYSSPCCGLKPSTSSKLCGSSTSDDSNSNNGGNGGGTNPTPNNLPILVQPSWSSVSSTNIYSENPSPFTEGLRLLENGCVEEALQIGFHLSGVVRSLSVIEGERQAFNVSVSFDRCKITAVKCSCDSRDIHWCQHVVAISLHRIRFPEKAQLRLPISETLCQMDREQLQKFVQYLIAEHHTEVLPTAQSLADEIMQPKSDINCIAGAPDPTAGPSADGDHSWYLDESQVCSMVRTYLSQTSSMEQLHSLFAKVREMLKKRDENGPRLLRLLTEQFLNYPWLGSLRSSSYHTPTLSEKCQQLWDQLGALWVCVVLNPYCKMQTKAQWYDLLKKWIAVPTCPPENGSYLPPTSLLSDVLGSSSSGNGHRPRTVFHRAMDACRIQWTDKHLRRILRRSNSLKSGRNDKCQISHLPLFTEEGCPMWHEHVPTACARVDCLRSHGYKNEALSLAVAIVRSIKHWQKIHLRDYEKGKDQSPMLEGWIGHPLDPINNLFDTLVSASEPKRCADSASTSSGKFPYVHIPPYDSKEKSMDDSSESYLTLAAEAAIIALGQQRRMPSCAYAKQKAVRQEDALIQKLRSVHLDETLMKVVKEQARLLLEGGSWSGLGPSLQPDAMPVHILACFLFEILLPHDSELAYKLGLRAMRISVIEDESDDANMLLGHPSAWAIPFSHVENQQSQLANSMLLASKDNVFRLRTVLEAIHAHMRSSSLVYRLAHEVHRDATSQPENSVVRQNLLNTALELGLQVLRMTVGSPSWSRREMVRWLVTCASSLSLDAVISILQNWHQLFTPIEASGTVAQMLIADTVVLQLKLDAKQHDELCRAIHRLALQCVLKNPPSCALHALSLCENNPKAFDEAYRLVVDAARTSCMPAQELFNIARHMEHRAHTLKAYEMAVLGLANTHIGYTDEASPLIQDVYWACWLGHRLGTYELANVISYIVKNVKCAPVLSAILRGYALGATGLADLCSTAAATVQPVKRKHSNSSLAHTKEKTMTPFDAPPLSQLLDAAIAAYVNTTHSRLTHISPRHYGEFIDFLSKARDTFILAQEGHIHFGQLLENMKLVYKGKKKLMSLISAHFG